LIIESFRNVGGHHVKLLVEPADLQFDLLSRDTQRAGLLPNTSGRASGRPGPKVQRMQVVSAISNTRQGCTKNRCWSCSFHSLLFCCAEPRWYNSCAPLVYLLQRNKGPFPRAAGIRLS